MATAVKTSMVRAALIAAAYTALTFVFAPIAYTPLQFRASEILMPLPYKRKFGKDAVIGLTVGGFLANLISMFGVFDMILGPLTNLAAGYAAYIIGRRMEGSILGRLAAVAASIASVAFFIGYILFHLIYKVPILESVGYIAASEAVTAGVGGYLLLEALDRRMLRE